MFYLDPNTLQRYRIGQPFTYGGVSYTRSGATHDRFMVFGFTQVIPQPRPNDRYYVVSGPKSDGTYDATPRDLDECKKSDLNDCKQTCRTLLAQTDWYAIRALDCKPMPEEVFADRANLRERCNAHEAAIQACQSVDELAQLTYYPREEDEPIESSEVPSEPASSD